MFECDTRYFSCLVYCIVHNFQRANNKYSTSSFNDCSSVGAGCYCLCLAKSLAIVLRDNECLARSQFVRINELLDSSDGDTGPSDRSSTDEGGFNFPLLTYRRMRGQILRS